MAVGCAVLSLRCSPKAKNIRNECTMILQRRLVDGAVVLAVRTVDRVPRTALRHVAGGGAWMEDTFED